MMSQKKNEKTLFTILGGQTYKKFCYECPTFKLFRTVCSRGIKNIKINVPLFEFNWGYVIGGVYKEIP